MNVPILKQTTKGLMKSKYFSLINVLGLSIAAMCVIMITFWIRYEWSYDRFNVNKDRIYRLKGTFDKTSFFALVPSPLVTLLEEQFPQVEATSRLMLGQAFLINQNDPVKEKRFAYGDAAMFKIFSFPLFAGDASELDTNGSAILISESMAKKYFGRSNAVGESIHRSNGKILQVVGVFKDIPENSHIKFDFMCSFQENIKQSIGWGNWNYSAYVLLSPNTTPEQMRKDAISWGEKNKHLFPANKNYLEQIDFQKLTDIHFESLSGDYEPAMDKRMVLAAGLVALFILIIAGINFMNLTLIGTYERLKEMGIKKVFGITRIQAMLIIFKETLLLSFIAFGVGSILTLLIVPYFNHFSGTSIHLSFFGSIWIISSIILIGVSLLSSIYPAFLFSRFTAAQILQKVNSFRRLAFVNVMVFVQLVISITLLCSILIIHRQMRFIECIDKGFNSEQIVNIKLESAAAWGKRIQIKNEIQKIASVASASLNNCDFASYQMAQINSINWKGIKNNVLPENQEKIWMIFADKDFIKTLGLEILQGKEAIDNQQEVLAENLNKEVCGLIYNQTANNRLEDHQKGRVFDYYSMKVKTIGVIKDFKFQSLHHPVEPAGIILTDVADQLSVRMRPGNHQETLREMENVVKSFAPAYPFSYSFLDQQMNSHYQSEQRTFSIILAACITCLFLSCLGMLGIISYATRKRIKEIGIRKVNGSTIGEIMLMLSKTIIWITTGAFLIAIPIVYYLMNIWMLRFAYRTTISWWLFGLGGIMALTIALVTVSWQCWKAATRNPVDVLRYE